jgi:carboxypeptidase C (cathepsin A)
VNFYTGVFDLDCNIAGHLAWLRNITWKGQTALANVERAVWHGGRGGEDIWGYARSVRGFTQLSIQNSGHMVPMNVPEQALAMLSLFIDGKPFL